MVIKRERAFTFYLRDRLDPEFLEVLGELLHQEFEEKTGEWLDHNGTFEPESDIQTFDHTFWIDGSLAFLTDSGPARIAWRSASVVANGQGPAPADLIAWWDYLPIEMLKEELARDWYVLPGLDSYSYPITWKHYIDSDLLFWIKTEEDPASIYKGITQATGAFNRESDKLNRGLIHYVEPAELWEPGTVYLSVDIGSAGDKGIEAVLKSLEEFEIMGVVIR